MHKELQNIMTMKNKGVIDRYSPENSSVRSPLAENSLKDWFDESQKTSFRVQANKVE